MVFFTFSFFNNDGSIGVEKITNFAFLYALRNSIPRIEFVKANSVKSLPKTWAMNCFLDIYAKMQSGRVSVARRARLRRDLRALARWRASAEDFGAAC